MSQCAATFQSRDRPIATMSFRPDGSSSLPTVLETGLSKGRAAGQICLDTDSRHAHALFHMNGRK
ncbi:hypothetical protein MGWOODY_Smn3672 [hydrothermal vent metagenome]|uniref:Uncharacterized protein n=1 Tax=hydrothermal vent metagenome TaxID=652676 RepID=A0A161K5E8_9ZZZZ